MENVSRETPLYVINEGSEPQYFTRFFSWDSAKSIVRLSPTALLSNSLPYLPFQTSPYKQCYLQCKNNVLHDHMHDLLDTA
jgi:hypothetical protein